MGLTSFEATNSVSNRTDAKISFSNSTPGYLITREAKQTIIKLKELLELREGSDIKLHVTEVKKRGYQVKIGDNEYKGSDLGNRKSEITEHLENVE